MTHGVHHLHLRKRLSLWAQYGTRSSIFERGLDILMYIVAIGSPLVLVPQAVQLFQTHDAAGVSLSTWLLLLCINILWTLYSIIHREWQLFLTSFLMGALDVVIATGILLYR